MWCSLVFACRHIDTLSDIVVYINTRQFGVSLQTDIEYCFLARVGLLARIESMIGQFVNIDSPLFQRTTVEVKLVAPYIFVCLDSVSVVCVAYYSPVFLPAVVVCPSCESG